MRIGLSIGAVAQRRGNSGGGGAPTPPPSLEPATRARRQEYLGSSNMQGTGSTATTDGYGTAIPAFYQGKNIATWTNALTLPTDGSAPTITNRGTAGNSPTQISAQLDAAIAADAAKAFDVVHYTGINFSGDTDLSIHNMTVDDMALMPASSNYFYYTPFATRGISLTSTNGYLLRRQAVRAMKYTQGLSDPKRIAMPMQIVYNTWAGDAAVPRVAADILDQRDGIVPNTLLANGDGSHSNGYGYFILNQPVTNWTVAIAGGPAFLPFNEYFGKVTGSAQKVCNLSYAGSLAGCTFASQDAAFNVVVNGTVLELWLTGSAPGADYTDVSITVAKSGYDTRTFKVRVSVSARGTAPAIVRFKNRCQIIDDAAFAGVSDSTAFSAVLILQYEEDDGTDPNVAANGSDTRNHYVFVTPSMEFRRTTAGVYTTFCVDASGTGRAWSGTTTVGTAPNSTVRRKDHGLHAMFFNWKQGGVDGGVAGGSKIWLSGGTLLSGGTYNAVSSALGAFTGTGTTGTQVANLDAVGATFGSTGAVATYFQGRKALVWMANSFLDFSVQANRDAFFNQATQMPVDIGNSGTVGGVTPYLYLPGDAAELYFGADDAHNAARGGRTAKNHGTGGNMQTMNYGRMTTL